MSFQLVPKSVTLNDIERRNGVILRCFSEFGYLPGVLRKSSRSLSHLLMSSCLHCDRSHKKNYAAFGAVSVISNLTLSDWTIDSCKKIRAIEYQ